MDHTSGIDLSESDLLNGNATTIKGGFCSTNRYSLIKSNGTSPNLDIKSPYNTVKTNNSDKSKKEPSNFDNN